MKPEPLRLTVEVLPGAVRDLEAIKLKTAENNLARIERYAEAAPSNIKKISRDVASSGCVSANFGFRLSKLVCA